MKAKEKKHHLETEGEETEEKPQTDESREEDHADDICELPSAEKTPKKNRMLACLHSAWARVTCKWRKIPSIEERGDLPAPSNIHLTQCTDGTPALRKAWAWIKHIKHRGTYYIHEDNPEARICNMEDRMVESQEQNSNFLTDNTTSKEKEAVADTPENKSLKAEGKEEEWASDCPEQQIIEEYQQMCDRINNMDDVYAQHHICQDDIPEEYHQISPQINEDAMSSQHHIHQGELLQEYHELCTQINAMEEVCPQHSTPRTHTTGKETDHIDEECSSELPGPSNINMEDRMVQADNTSTSKAIKEEDDEGPRDMAEISEQMMEDLRSVQVSSSSVDSNTPEELNRSTSSTSSSSHKEKSSKPDISMKEPGNTEETSSGTVPLSLHCFTFHSVLGKGTFGRVMLAKDVIRRDYVAIKVTDKRYFTKHGYSFVERHVLQLSHESPFLIHGLAAFHTLNFIYYVMELATGGDLFKLISMFGRLDIEEVKFITAEVVCGTEFLHRKGIIHRDLKLRNILQTAEGHIKIGDFGSAVTEVYEMTTDICGGTPGYAAPEMVNCHPHGRGVDYFAIGVIMYIISTFKRPFEGRNAQETNVSVRCHTPVYPPYLTPDTVTILKGLLCKDQFQRLGVKGDIRSHPFFSEMNWEDVEARRIEPPYVLRAAPVDLKAEQAMHYAEPRNVLKRDQKIFDEFSFICPEWSKHYHPCHPRPWRCSFM